VFLGNVFLLNEVFTFILYLFIKILVIFLRDVTGLLAGWEWASGWASKYEPETCLLEWFEWYFVVIQVNLDKDW